jgi:hypothetical protein
MVTRNVSKEIPLAKLLNLKPQTRKVLNHLTKRRSISPMEALTVYGIYRLSACIYDLRKVGIKIKTNMRKDAAGHNYARYEVAA